MTTLDYRDLRSDPQTLAQELGISLEAAQLYGASEVLDLHLEGSIWTRIFGYDHRRRHGGGLFGNRFYSQLDFPRVLEGGLTGGCWVITTNPFRSARGRERVFFQNLAQTTRLFEEESEHFRVVRDVAEYRAARAGGLHGAFLGVQGGNAFDHDLASLERIPQGAILRVTLVHLSTSRLGTTSSPAQVGKDAGLSALGKELVERLDALRIFTDLAHISKKGFWDAVEVHDDALPLIVTHTGVSGVNEHWRNLDDDQLRAIADSGGTIGVMYQSSFLGDATLGGRAAKVVDHLEHIVDTVGEDHASLGSDWDGAILPPRDLKSPLELARLVQIMLDRGFSAQRVQKILGLNALNAIERLRPS